MSVNQHFAQCSWHCDQYDFECDCGAINPPTKAWAQRELAAAEERVKRAQEVVAAWHKRIARIK